MDNEKVNLVMDLALDHFQDQALLHKWLEAQNPALEGDRPIDMIAKGALDKLLKILDH